MAAMTAGARAADADLTGIHTVAVVLMMKSDLQLQTMGLTRFDNSENAVPTDWDLNGAALRRLTAALGGRFELRPGTLPPGIFDHLDGGLFESPRTVFAKRIQALTPPPGVDAYLVLAQGPGLMRDETRGIFLYHDAGLITGKGTLVSLPWGIALYDVHTGKMLASGVGKIPWRDTFSGYGEATEMCADEIWPESPAALTDAQKARIRQETFSLIERSAPFALYDAGIIPEDAAKAMLASATPAEPSCHGIP